MRPPLTSVFQMLPTAAAEAITLDQDTIAVWWMDLEWPETKVALGHRILSREEQDRASRFRKNDDARHFIAAHAALRMILARYLESDPRTLRFVINDNGKPYLTGQSPGRDVAFNLAHSSGRAVCAITLRLRVGVDLERIRSDVSFLEIARRYFHRNEARHLAALSGDALMRAFYRLWTTKEAYAKGKGGGLSIPFDSFELPVLTRDSPWFIPAAQTESEGWALFDISPNDSYAAAVALSGRDGVGLRIVHSKFDSAEIS